MSITKYSDTKKLHTIDNLQNADAVKTGIVPLLPKEFESNVFEHSELLGILLDSFPDAIYFKDTQSRFVRVSKSLLAKFGLSDPSAMIGKTDFDFFSTEHAQQAYRDEQNIIKTGKPLVGFVEKETYANRPDKWVSTTKMPLFDHNGVMYGICGISRDITDAVRMEEELTLERNALEHRVDERTRDLSDVNKTLTYHLAQLNFLSNAMHEIAQYISIENLYPVIVKTFKERFIKVEVCLCSKVNEEFHCINSTHGFQNGIARHAAEQLPLLLDILDNPVVVSEENRFLNEFITKLDWPGLEQFPSYCAFPLVVEKKVLGIIQIFTTMDNFEVFVQEQTMLTTLASHAAICLSNAIYYHDLGESSRIQSELDVARSIQRRFIPHDKPDIPRINCKGAYFPAYEVGGDYLDYFKSDLGTWVIVVADVCGKGIPAALLAAMLRSVVHSEAQRNLSPKKFLCAINEAMKANLDNWSFITALCCMISSDGRSMKYARAGHPNLVRIPAHGGQLEVVPCAGIALGMLFGQEAFGSLLDEVIIPLVSGDRFFIYTDGLTDAVNPAKQTFGQERLFESLTHCGTFSADGIIDSLLRTIKDFSHGSPYRDDLTMLALEVLEDE